MQICCKRRDKERERRSNKRKNLLIQTKRKRLILNDQLNKLFIQKEKNRKKLMFNLK